MKGTRYHHFPYEVDIGGQKRAPLPNMQLRRCDSWLGLPQPTMASEMKKIHAMIGTPMAYRLKLLGMDIFSIQEKISSYFDLMVLHILSQRTMK